MAGLGKLMSVEDVCDYLGLSRYFLYDQVRLGVLPCADRPAVAVPSG